MKFMVMLDDGVDTCGPTEIEASTPQEAAEKFADEVENGVEDGDTIVVAERIFRFQASAKMAVKQIITKKKMKTSSNEDTRG